MLYVTAFNNMQMSNTKVKRSIRSIEGSKDAIQSIFHIDLFFNIFYNYAEISSFSNKSHII